MDKFTASVIRKVLDAVQVDYYTERIPKQVKTPSLFFHNLGFTPEMYTKFEWKMSYNQEISVFEKDSVQAEALAQSVITALMEDKKVVKVVNQDGSYSGAVFVINGITSLEQQEGIYRVSLDWQIEYNY